MPSLARAVKSTLLSSRALPGSRLAAPPLKMLPMGKPPPPPPPWGGGGGGGPPLPGGRRAGGVVESGRRLGEVREATAARGAVGARRSALRESGVVVVAMRDVRLSMREGCESEECGGAGADEVAKVEEVGLLEG